MNFIFESNVQVIFEGLVKTVSALAVDIDSLLLIIFELFSLSDIKERSFEPTVDHDDY